MRQPPEHRSGYRSAYTIQRARLAQRVLAAAVVAAFGNAPGMALAQESTLPSGLQVTSGMASLQTAGKQMTIANSPNAVLDWQSFSIGAGNGVHFQQANAASKVLNRVVGNDPSTILGSLSSNGEVWLVNPNGVLFGAGARIDVGALVASSLGVRNEDFLVGRHRFGEGAAAGSVVNRGELSTSFGGRVWLVGGTVHNEGTIDTPGGQIVLAAGQSIDLVDSGVPNVTVRVSAPDSEAVNLGSLLAPGGGSIDLHGAIVNQRGIVRADSVGAASAGRVTLRAHSDLQLASSSITSADADGAAAGGLVRVESVGGTVSVAGSVSANSASGIDGEIGIAASDVRLDGALVQTGGAIRIDGSTSIGMADTRLGAHATGDSIVLSTPAITVSGSRLTTPNGRWLVYLDRIADLWQSPQLNQLGFTFVQVGAAEGSALPAARIGQHGVVVRENLDARIHVDADRVYDGSTRATISQALSSDLPIGLALDRLSVTYQADFADKHAGVGKPIDYRGAGPLFGIVTATGQSVYGVRQAYVADVARAPVTVGQVAAQDKVYDGTRAASVSGALVGPVTGDNVRLIGASGLFADKNAGVGKTVTLSGGVLSGADARNYNLVGGAATGRATITPRAISASALTAQDKVYDGTRVATFSGTLTGILAGDNVVLGSATGQFADKKAGVAKLVSVDGVTLSGVDARNYILSAPADVRATISPREVTLAGLAAQDKIYDGTRDAQVSATLADAVTGDAVSLEIAGQFDTRDAGSGKTVALTGSLTGADAANYALSMPASASAAIMHRALHIVIDSAPRKEYDATTTIDLEPGAYALDGVVAGDALAVRGPAHGHFDSRDAGSGKRIVASGVFEILGTDAANYRIDATILDSGSNRVATTAMGARGEITPATLVYNARPGVVIGGLDVDGLGGTITGFKGNDTLANSTLGALQWHTTVTPASAPGSHPIFGSGLTAANYVLVQAPGNASALDVRAGLPAGGPLQRAQDGGSLAIASALQAALPASCSMARVWPQCDAAAEPGSDR
ncbi:YDG domain-containing protein [Massilia sp. HP4]|uniref:YDG domain-containing protein n=1 Tax=Massilia sp. HP4 TaxID=2562316 RepID=UPI0010C0B4B1|nr:YDG domain-containing protein [Massilia sp. HP4]